MGSLESDTTERIHFHFSLSCIGEGNGNPLQSSCLENPREGKPGWLPSMGSHRVRHDWSNAAAGPSILLQMAIFHSFLWLSNIPLYICTNLLYPLLSWWTFRLLPCPAIVNSVCAASLLTFTAGSHPGDTPPMFLYWAPPSAFLSRSCFQNLNPFWAQ